MTKALEVLDERTILGQEFKVYGDIENPLFIASDVAYWIGHADVTTMLRKIDDDEKLTRSISGAGQIRKVNCLTEDGLYEVLMLSRKPLAKEFKRKIKMVLKQLRRGSVLVSKEDMLAMQTRLSQLEQRLLVLEPPVIDWQTSLTNAVNDLLSSGNFYLEGMRGHASTLALPTATKIGYIRTSINSDQLLMMASEFRRALHTIGYVLPKSYNKLVEAGVVVRGTKTVTKVLKWQGVSTRLLEVKVALDPEAVLLE